MGMLTNFGSMALDRIHNTLKVRMVLPLYLKTRMVFHLFKCFDTTDSMINSISNVILLPQMFCIADPPYDKSLQQLQSFLSGLVSEEKLDLRDGMYLLKK